MLPLKPWMSYKNQWCNLGGSIWNIPRLIELSRDLEVKEMPLEHLNVSSVYPDINSTVEYISHLVAVQEADLSCPIILDSEGCIFDGRHRITKALLLGKETIKYVRFDEDPEPDRRD